MLEARASEGLRGSARISGWAFVGCGVMLLMCGRAAWGQQDQPLTSNDVGIDQVTYSDSSENYASGTGLLILDQAELANRGITSGYVNVSDGDGWAVQNVPIMAGMPALAIPFDMGTADGTTDTSLNLTVDISGTLDTSMPAAGGATFSVGTDVENPDGDGGSDTDQATGMQQSPEGGAGKPAKPTVTVLPFNKNGVTRGVSQYFQYPKQVQAADNQCGPAAVANNLTYLSSKGMLTVPDSNTPGRGLGGNSIKIARPGQTPNESAPGPGETSLVAQLDNTMGRASTSRISGNTVGTGQIISGAEKYLGTNGNAGALVEETASVTSPPAAMNGVSNKNVAGTLPDFLFNEMSKGWAVTMIYNWSTGFTAGQPSTNGDSQWSPIGGHFVDVEATGSIEDVPYAVYDSDWAQTPYDAGDSMLNESTLNLPFLGALNTYDIPRFSWLYANNYDTGWYNTNYSLSNEAGFNWVATAVAIGPEPGTIGMIAMAGSLFMARRRRSAVAA
jgi:hypothetical protein